MSLIVSLLVVSQSGEKGVNPNNLHFSVLFHRYHEQPHHASNAFMAQLKFNPQTVNSPPARKAIFVRPGLPGTALCGSDGVVDNVRGGRGPGSKLLAENPKSSHIGSVMRFD
jgi:hypothetical protein